MFHWSCSGPTHRFAPIIQRAACTFSNCPARLDSRLPCMWAWRSHSPLQRTRSSRLHPLRAHHYPVWEPHLLSVNRSLYRILIPISIQLDDNQSHQARSDSSQVNIFRKLIKQLWKSFHFPFETLRLTSTLIPLHQLVVQNQKLQPAQHVVRRKPPDFV